MLGDAVEHDEILVNPLADWRMKRKRIPARELIDPFSPEEMAAIVSALPAQAGNLIQFAFWSGLRTSELIALEWGDVDWRKGEIVVRRAKVRNEIKAPKTKASERAVKLLEPALGALTRQKAHTYVHGREVFHNPRTGAPWLNDAAIRKTAWQPALRRAKVRYRYPYQTRHTYASMMLSAGENPLWVARQMGHRDWSMIVRTYGKWIPEAEPRAGAKAVTMFFGRTGTRGMLP
jgi:integrase